MTAVDRAKLAAFREKLLEERRIQVARIKSLREAGLGEGARASARELSSYDQHPADLGSEMFEREKDLGLWAAARGILAQIDDALARLQAGTYGMCAECGSPIDPARLEALPYAVRCVPCEAAVEKRRAQTLEEAAPSPDFSSFEEEADRAFYDAEDAWQDVARFGTANSPQDVPGAVDFDETYIGAGEDVGTVTELDAVSDDGEPWEERGSAK